MPQVPVPLLSRASLLCLSGAFTLPFLLAHHQNPIPTFYQEWLAAALSVLAAFILWQRHLIQSIEIPRIALIPLGLIAILAIQYVAGLPQSTSRALLVALYLLWSMLLMVTACNLRRTVSTEKIAHIAALAILIGAVLSACILALQIAQLGLDTGLVFPKPKGTGNLGQRNHLADYLWLGIASAVYLRLERRLGLVLFIATVAGLATASSLTGSRSILVYAASLVVLSAWSAWQFKSPTLKGAAIVTSVLFCFTVLAQWLLVASSVSSALDTAVSGQRLMGEVQGNSQRLLLWRIGLAIFADHPWLGAGVGQFPYHSYLTLGHQNDGSYLAGGEHAHNLFIHLLSEFGIAAPLLVLIVGWQWWRTFIGTPWNHTHWWIAALLLVLGIHSQLEYPMWLAFFLGIASFALGLGSTRVLHPHISRGGTWIVRLILTMAATTLISLFVDYGHLENALRQRVLDKEGRPVPASTRLATLARLHRESLFADYVPLIYAYQLEVDREVISDKITVCETAIRFSPVDAITFKLAWLLALDDRRDEARIALSRAMATHPGYFPTATQELNTLSGKFPELAWLSEEIQRLSLKKGR